jgi:TetR/AcrR family transcriptional regulator of autoinduction and epiphytic fitness
LRSSGGRPRAADAALLGERIVAAASMLFMRDGYAATSIEAIAAAAGVSKRTFYVRFETKSAIFLAVVRDLIHTWLSGFDETLEASATLEDALFAASRKMLDVALTPSALALHALVTGEAMRFPEMGAALRQSGADVGMKKVSALLLFHAPHLTPEHAYFVAEQFQSLIVLAPQRRAMGMGPPLDPAARDRWCRATVDLVLRGILTPGAPAGAKPRTRLRSASNRGS